MNWTDSSQKKKYKWLTHEAMFMNMVQKWVHVYVNHVNPEMIPLESILGIGVGHKGEW
jgi:hypothetical protein